MLLWNLDLLFNESTRATFLLLIASMTIAMLVALTIHEFGHAFVANRLGDPTPRMLGRLSLNPVRHLDPFGTLMIFLAGFGWGKPVPVNASYFGRDPRKGMALAASAGPLSNLILAALFGVLVRADVVAWQSPLQLRLVDGWDGGLIAASIVGWLVFLNLMLAVFNLIPIAPLDGFRIAVGVLPGRQAYALARTERYGSVILLTFIFLGYMSGWLWDFLQWAVGGLALAFIGKGV